MKSIDNIYIEYVNGNYYVDHFNEEYPLPDKVNVKNAVFYYVNYIYHNKLNDDYYKELASFVMIPTSKIIINNMNEFIEIIQYIKYNMDPQIIVLNRVNFNMMKVSELKQYCRDNKIKGFSKYRKKDLVEFIRSCN